MSLAKNHRKFQPPRINDNKNIASSLAPTGLLRAPAVAVSVMRKSCWVIKGGDCAVYSYCSFQQKTDSTGVSTAPFLHLNHSYNTRLYTTTHRKTGRGSLEMSIRDVLMALACNCRQFNR